MTTKRLPQTWMKIEVFEIYIEETMVAFKTKLGSGKGSTASGIFVRAANIIADTKSGAVH